MTKYNIVSLFTGAGGLDLGFYLNGKYKTVLANEILLPPVKTYSKNFKIKILTAPTYTRQDLPAVINADVEKVDFREVADLDIDVVIGGPPCQDFSIIRGPPEKRQGIKVKRGRLYAHFVRALFYIQPKIFVFENVPGLVNANRGLAYKTILQDLQNLQSGWTEAKKILNAKNNNHKAIGYHILFSGIVDMTRLGLPQKRERLIIIGVRKDLIKDKGASGVWLEIIKLKQTISNIMNGKPYLFSKYPLTPIEVFEGRPIPELQSVYEEIMKEYEGVWNDVKTPTAYKWKQSMWDKLTFDIVKDYLFLNKIKNAEHKELEEAFEQHKAVLKEMGYYMKNVESIQPEDGSNKTPEESENVMERLARIPPGENHEFVRGTVWEVKALLSNIYRRVHPIMPSPTIIAYGGGGTWGYHYKRTRGMLTNRERARLQSFPDWFLFEGSSSQIRAQIGEAVPPLISKRISEVLEKILATLEEKKTTI